MILMITLMARKWMMWLVLLINILMILLNDKVKHKIADDGCNTDSDYEEFNNDCSNDSTNGMEKDCAYTDDDDDDDKGANLS